MLKAKNKNAGKTSGLRIFVDRCENGNELTGLVQQPGHSRSGNTNTIHEQFEPILSFIDLLQAFANLGNKLGFGAASRCLAKALIRRLFT
jgi:hypothetical protein